jgi:hypothetical protein
VDVAGFVDDEDRVERERFAVFVTPAVNGKAMRAGVRLARVRHAKQRVLRSAVRG